MKRKLYVLLVIAVFLFSFTGCAKKEEAANVKGPDGDWSISLPEDYAKEKEEKLDDPKANIITYQDKKNDKTFIINEMMGNNIEINEETLKTELTEDTHLHVDKTEIIDVKGVGKLYGAMIKDEGTGVNIMYYRIKKQDKAISFIAYQKNEFSIEEEAKIKAILTSLKFIK